MIKKYMVVNLSIPQDRLLSDRNVFEVEKGMAVSVITILVFLVTFIVILLIKLKKKSNAETIAKQAKKELRENYKELEIAYEEVNLAKAELSLKFDELKKNKEKIRKLAYSDHLTELPNRLALTEMLDSVMLTRRNEEVIAVMDIDLDNFKHINDTLGHAYGDELLIDVTHRLKQAIDENDYLARIGGDEFCIISQNIDDISDYEVKVKKVQKIFDYPFVLSMKEYFVTVSIGITMSPKDGKTTSSLIKNADSAMYAAKESGKNTYYYFNESINEKLTEKIQIQSELRKAIENNEFVLYYQPQVDLNSNTITGVEALIRWNHPTKGILAPNDFIGLAEETGLIVSIGQWVLKEACNQIKEWDEEGNTGLVMAINISVRQFRDHDFVNMVREIICETGINPHQIELEITESIALDDIQYTVETIKKLQEIGIVFSLDDFGTGYSSMNYLKQLPVNNLKIDKSFLDTVLDNKDEQCIVEAIITLARTLNLVVIAEGVEKSEQQDFLKGVRCDKAQGYLYSKPLPKDEIAAVLFNK